MKQNDSDVTGIPTTVGQPEPQVDPADTFGSEPQEQTAPEQYDPNDPMNEDVGGIRKTLPLLPAGLYDCNIDEVMINDSKSNPGGQVAKVKLTLLEDAVDTDGEVVNKGFPVYLQFGITPTEKYTAKMIAQKIAVLLDRCGITSGVTPRQFINNPDQIVGATVRAKVSIRKETDEYAASNEVKALVQVK